MARIAGRSCSREGCDRPHRARGLCSSHYNQEFQPDRHRSIPAVCCHCGGPCMKDPSNLRKYDFVYCSPRCRDLRRSERAALARRAVATTKPPRDMRSPMRRAIEERDYVALAIAIRGNCDVRVDGCWEWKRRVQEGYPVARVGKRQLAVHRLACETRVGAPLGDQAAHHKCANTRCVNPDHLEPVTAAANTVEMLARTYMLRRIRALESALRAAAPEHPLLGEVGIRAAA